MPTATATATASDESDDMTAKRRASTAVRDVHCVTARPVSRCLLGMCVLAGEEGGGYVWALREPHGVDDAYPDVGQSTHGH